MLNILHNQSVDENTGKFIDAIKTRNTHIMKICDVFKEMIRCSNVKILTETTENAD